MILDKLENADNYFDCVPGLERFIDFWKDNDLEAMPACKIRLDGNDFVINIQFISLSYQMGNPMVS